MESTGFSSPAVLNKATKSSSKAKTKSSGGKGGRFKANSKLKRTANSNDPDQDLDDSFGDGTPEKFGIHKKQKELPKPAITIFMHHPWPFKNQNYLQKVRF